MRCEATICIKPNFAFKDSHSLSGTDELVASQLLVEAYRRKRELRAQDKLARSQDQAYPQQEQAA